MGGENFSPLSALCELRLDNHFYGHRTSSDSHPNPSLHPLSPNSSETEPLSANEFLFYVYYNLHLYNFFYIKLVCVCIYVYLYAYNIYNVVQFIFTQSL